MTRAGFAKIFAYFSLIFLCTMATAQTAPESVASGPTLWLVMIDVDNYQDTNIKAKTSNKQLVDGLENYFRAIPRDAPPFTARKLWRLSSSAADAKTHPRADVIRAVFNNADWGLSAKAQPGDDVIFCFAGEGVARDGGRTLLTIDSTLADPSTNSLPLAEVEQWLAALKQKQISANMYIICDFAAGSGATQIAAVTPTAAATTPPRPTATPVHLKPIEGVVVFDNPAFGKGTVHRVVLQDESGRQMYLSWDREVTETLPADGRPRLGARMAVAPTSGDLDEEGAVAITRQEEIRILGMSPTAVWPPKADLANIGPTMANRAVWTEGQIAKIAPGADPLPTFMTITNGSHNLDVVFWDNTSQVLNQTGKMPKVGDKIRIGGLVQMYKGNVQFRFNHPEYLAVVN